MPIADPSSGWQEALAGFAVISIVAFLVTWVVTDLGRVSRTPYIAVLALTTISLAGGYLAWSGTGATDLVTTDWGWGVFGGVITAALVAPLVQRLPAGPRPHGAELARRLLWEGVVYGTAEAILLATLPVLSLWQAADALGWTDTPVQSAGSGALATVGALFVIVVHHLGYREFRARSSRRMLLGAMVGCGIQALAFLLTGNVLAPIVAHILLHWQLTSHGNEMPPASEIPSEPAGRGTELRAPAREEAFIA